MRKLARTLNNPPLRFSRRRGATTVELALTLPILFLLLFGCYEFARLNMIRHATEAAAYEGARAGIVPGATVEDVRNATELILATVGVSRFDVVVEPDPLGLESDTVCVSVAVRPKDNTLIAPLFSDNVVLSGACQLGREGH